DHGKIVALDTPLALKAAVGADTVTLSTENDESALANLLATGRDATKVERGVLVKVAEGTKSVAALIGEANEPVRNVQVHQPTLDDVFMHYTGREIRDAPANDKGSAAVFARMARRG